MIRSLMALLLATSTAAFAADEQALLTSAANVRLRSAAGTEAAIVEMLPLGTRLAATGQEQAGGWLPVRVARDGGPQGWVSSTLTVPFTQATFPDVIEALITDRLAREGDGFGARRELLELIESVPAQDWSADARARLALQRLRALQDVLHGIPHQRNHRDQQMLDWARDHGDEVRYNEPGGNWLVRRDTILAAHEAHRGTAPADDIAWLLVQTGVAGECEGDVVCYLERMDMVEGEYLRREPGGRHVGQVLGRIDERVAGLLDGLTRRLRPDGPTYYSLDAPGRCPDLGKAVRSLELAVQGSDASSGQQLIARLHELAARCS